MKAKVYEMRQEREKLLGETRELVERSQKENRSLKPDEQTAFDAKLARSDELAKMISQADRLIAMDKIGDDNPTERRSAPLPHEDPTNTKHGKHAYSLLKAVRQTANNRQYNTEALDGLELEVSQEIAHRTQKKAQGFFMPMGSRPQVRRLATGRRKAEYRALDSTAGTGSIPTILEADWIELLRNRMITMQAGAREILDLQGKFAIPRQNAAATAYWVNESGSPTGSNQTLDQVPFTPHTIGAFTDISRRFFELTVINSGEEFVREDLTAILARGLDLAALNGPGSGGAPLGLMQNTAITGSQVVSLGTNGGVPTFSALVELETIVARGNADIGALSYVTNADGRGTMKNTAKIGSTFPVFLWEDDEINGYPAYATQQLPNTLTKGTGTGLSPVIYGNWNDMVFAHWSGIDILVDPYTGSSSGTVRVVALQDADVQIRHNQSFSLILDLISDQTQ